MLTAQEAFKVGFLARCVEDGLSPERMLQSVKVAADLMEKRAFLGTLVEKGLDAVKGVGGAALQYGVPLAVAAPPILGGMAGYGLAKATDIDDTDVADVKSHELIDEYRRQAEAVRRRQASRDRRPEHRPSPRMYM